MSRRSQATRSFHARHDDPHSKRFVLQARKWAQTNINYAKTTSVKKLKTLQRKANACIIYVGVMYQCFYRKKVHS